MFVCGRFLNIIRHVRMDDFLHTAFLNVTGICAPYPQGCHAGTQACRSDSRLNRLCPSYTFLGDKQLERSGFN